MHLNPWMLGYQIDDWNSIRSHSHRKAPHLSREGQWLAWRRSYLRSIVSRNGIRGWKYRVLEPTLKTISGNSVTIHKWNSFSIRDSKWFKCNTKTHRWFLACLHFESCGKTVEIKSAFEESEQRFIAIMFISVFDNCSRNISVHNNEHLFVFGVQLVVILLL